MRRVRIAVSLMLLALLATAAVATGAGRRGGLDRSYGHGGIVQVTAPGAPQTTSPEGAPSAYLIVTSFGEAGDGSTYALGNENECSPTFECTESTFLERYGSDGRRDESFGEGNRALLSYEEFAHVSVIADGSGRAVVIGMAGRDIDIRRFGVDGEPDQSFGSDGVVRIPCACGLEAQLHLLSEPGGGLLVDTNSPIGFFERGTRVRLTRLEPDGTVDRSFGTAGTTRFTVHGPGEPRAVVTGAGGATLIGGSGAKGCCGPRRIWLWRVSGGGRVDRSFSRNATHSLRRVATLNKYPTLGAIVPQPGGGVAALGEGSKWGVGFDLSLRSDGRLATDFGKDGLLALRFNLTTAVGGSDGMIVGVGESEAGGYRAYRILPGGTLDPAYGGRKGIALPLNGIRVHATSLPDGRVVVTDNGNSFCREACRSRPAIARLLG